jgi:hypothetical protein
MNAAAKSFPVTPESDLRFGRRIHCILYGGKNGTIFDVHGTPDLGNSKTIFGNVGHHVTGPQADIDVVWDNGTISRRVPECIVKGVQWSFLDQPDQTNDVISKALTHAENEQKRKIGIEEGLKQAFDTGVRIFRENAELSYMEQTPTDGSYCDHTKLVAKNIRKQLKKTFPSVKFSVRKEHYDAIWVEWRAADNSETVTQKTVRETLSRFQTGYYDMHTDTHRKSPTSFNAVYGGVSHLTIQASFS